MEREEKNIFYIGAALEGREKKRILLAKGLPIKKSGRGFSYLSYEGRTVTSRLQVYFALMPRFEKGLFGERGFKAATAERILEKTLAKAGQAYGCREQIVSPGLGAGNWELPLELWAVCLYQQRPFDRICLSLPEEVDYYGEQAMELLYPYLPRMRRAYYYGEESENCSRLKEVLADEFGLILTEVRKPDPKIVWLDLRREGQSGDTAAKCVNRNLVWNFLDTTVKNGYNTEVN